MSDIIHLLPDSVANQIAAGEVIQRPASAVKELLENAIDAGSDTITLVIKDAGKALIQVIDNGSGMSETDARLSFERHATSKISCADDLFNLNTKGFRGEALASIAAIAQVELKTKKEGLDLGSKILIEGSEVKEQEPCSAPKGTSFSIKNLFFNVPARRNFLKSNPIEIKHIIDEFQRVALAHPNIAFSMYNAENEVFNLKKGSFRQRIVGVFGEKYNQKLVPVAESTDIVTIDGFVSKPEFAKKTRGEQYFFVNDRFIKNAYLNHAVQNAYDQLLSKDQFPSYFINLKIDPSKIDINIHPTKTEIKFEDERSIYAIIRTSVKQALGKYNISPTLDFEQETSFDIPLSKRMDTIKAPTIKVNPNYNPFSTDVSSSNKSSNNGAIRAAAKQESKNWESLYDNFEKSTTEIIEHQPQENVEQQVISSNWDEETERNRTLLQLHKKYIFTQLKSGYLIIDQQRAHERVLYEKFNTQLKTKKSSSQQLLFPETIEFTSADGELLNEIKPEISALGFVMDKVGRSSFVISGIPSEIKEQNIKQTIEKLLEQFKLNNSELKLDKKENLATSLARSASIKAGQYLNIEEMNNLVDNLFACEMPYSLPNGKPTIISLNLDDLNKQFNY
ncbi:DNA mismatch repair endonuclease MutL [Vicingus serpentipes]|uniref:DNA mismatch repair protein MutL n=1 Tax=Vicingus serpentipes TaxID=1926625 RepID=A0A5C6RSX0_9FLAO|nr:DNA mismatch repair endonuclease MutL [Vicingus serpentipes]TXB65353.1 DNA mismatch repair endonuclease MutL [Vicingus serpentipes]